MTPAGGVPEAPHPVVQAARRRQVEHAILEAAAIAPHSAYAQLKRTVRRGILLSVVPFVVLVSGLALLPIPAAVITSGFLTSESAPKVIQAAETGVIEKILVQDGARVEAGQPLIVLDDTAARADLAIASKGLEQLQARDARLQAEALGYDEIIFPAELLIRRGVPEIASLIDAERALFTLRRDAFLSQLSQMREQVVQIDAQVKGVEGQIEAAQRQREVLSGELENLRQLLADQLISAQRVNEGEQNLSIIEGQLAELNATIALARGKRAELGSRIAELETQRMSDAAEEQRDVQARMAELVEKQIAARRRVEQTVLTAPVAGTVTDLRVRTVGGVVSASETLMTIVPGDDRLIAELKVLPRDIGNVRLGQAAELHFTAFGGASAPEFEGKVSFVAPDVVADQRTGASYFVVRVAVGAPLNDEARAMDAFGSGMPVEVFLLSEARTVLDYLARPILDQARRAFR